MRVRLRMSKTNRVFFMRDLLVALFLLPGLPNIASADPAPECGASSQLEIGTCVADMLKGVDATVDVYLGLAMTSAKELDDVTGRAAAIPSLETAQAAELAYRDAHGEYVGATLGGGSGTGIGIDSCKIDLGRDRAKQLML